jgi:general secretion pathway protein A
LNAQEVGRYIAHRLAVAGIREDLFTSVALRLIHHYSGGIPRIINSICERTLLAIYTSGRQRVGAKLVWRAAREVKGRRSGKRRWLWGGALLIPLISVLGFFYGQTDLDPAVESNQVKKLADKAILELPETVDEQHKVVVPAVPEGKADQAEVPAPPPVKEVLDEKVINSQQNSPGLNQTELPDDDFKLARLFSQPQNLLGMYQMLLGLWGETKQLQDNTPPCLQVRKFDLRCLTSVTDWANLLGMNRPLLLQLKQDDQHRLLLLKHVDGEWLLVNNGNQDGVIKRSQLMRFWNGGYIMLWRPLTEIALIGEGSSGSAVTWLRKRLQSFDGIKPPVIVGVDRFDTKLEDRLKAFQQRQGLTADGVAGEQTMIHLNNLAIPAGTPTLVSTQDLAGG